MNNPILLTIAATADWSSKIGDKLVREPFNPGTCKSMKNLSPKRFAKRRAKAKTARKSKR